MAVSISLSPAPGLFVGQTSATVSMTASGYSTILASTTSQPTFAKNIAYDEFGNPFLSVVQDGKGNVFFDGGFPKYYNNTWSPAYTTFGAMTNQLKLLYNAMKWCAEGNVVANNKILLFGDALVGEPYAVKDTAANGFTTCITNVGALAGFTVTTKDLGDYPLSSDIPLSYLQQFSSVIFFEFVCNQLGHSRSTFVSELACEYRDIPPTGRWCDDYHRPQRIPNTCEPSCYSIRLLILGQRRPPSSFR